MNTRQSWIIGVAIVLGCVILGLFFGQPAPGQKKDNPVTPGRYQMLVEAGNVFVIDTVTGKTSYYDGKWLDLGSPAQQRKKD